MGRPKKIHVSEESLTASKTSSATVHEKKTKEPVILPLSLDFTSEDLNNLTSKVNEIIIHLNEKDR